MIKWLMISQDPETLSGTPVQRYSTVRAFVICFADTLQVFLSELRGADNEYDAVVQRESDFEVGHLSSIAVSRTVMIATLGTGF